MSMPSLSDILNSLSSPTEKTAADASVRSNSRDLGAAVRAAVHSAGSTEKTAAAPRATPQGDLTKIAQRLATAEQEALVKEAELFGAALCDGFVSRMSGYEAAGGVKVASAGPATFEKFAADNPDLVKQAMELGYRETREKLAAAQQNAYQEGYEKTAAVIKTAAQNAYQEGYEKTAAVVKTAAEHCAHKGYRNTNGILARLR